MPIPVALQLSSQLSLTAELIEGYNKAIPTPKKKLHTNHQLNSKLNKHIGRKIEQINIPATINKFLPIISEYNQEKICRTPHVKAYIPTI